MSLSEGSKSIAIFVNSLYEKYNPKAKDCLVIGDAGDFSYFGLFKDIEYKPNATTLKIAGVQKFDLNRIDKLIEDLIQENSTTTMICLGDKEEEAVKKLAQQWSGENGHYSALLSGQREFDIYNPFTLKLELFEAKALVFYLQ